MATAAFVVVALIASEARIDISVLIWCALGIFGLVFGLTTVGGARHIDAHPQVQAVTAPVALVERGPESSSESLSVGGDELIVEAVRTRTPKHAAELAL
ncbi:hypothetical protein RBS60_01265 [Sinomonas sp. ASV486]|uniref:hypothetical protein n=1 Tax=Sinomonas sp. ASV486 TaxID=3051170 RepID=UPI0027DB492A|nr:hypothetical protein [Sinomonas sp. ASV486]MDQ4488821.1 hypothetical protein [Sinomonas sp. ASV486]